jgi:hypothetical protein
MNTKMLFNHAKEYKFIQEKDFSYKKTNFLQKNVLKIIIYRALLTVMSCHDKTNYYNFRLSVLLLSFFVLYLKHVILIKQEKELVNQAEVYVLLTRKATL